MNFRKVDVRIQLGAQLDSLRMCIEDAENNGSSSDAPWMSSYRIILDYIEWLERRAKVQRKTKKRVRS